MINFCFIFNLTHLRSVRFLGLVTSEIPMIKQNVAGDTETPLPFTILIQCAVCSCVDGLALCRLLTWMELSSGFFSVKSFCFTFNYLVSCLNGNEMCAFTFNSPFLYQWRVLYGIEDLVLQSRFGYGHCPSFPAWVICWIVFVQKLVDMYFR